MTAAHKYICDFCGSHINGEDMLSAQNPFDDSEVISGCPNCKTVERLSIACDQPGCWEKYQVGKPTPDGHKLLCYRHAHWVEAPPP